MTSRREHSGLAAPRATGDDDRAGGARRGVDEGLHQTAFAPVNSHGGPSASGATGARRRQCADMSCSRTARSLRARSDGDAVAAGEVVARVRQAAGDAVRLSQDSQLLAVLRLQELVDVRGEDVRREVGLERRRVAVASVADLLERLVHHIGERADLRVRLGVRAEPDDPVARNRFLERGRHLACDLTGLADVDDQQHVVESLHAPRATRAD